MNLSSYLRSGADSHSTDCLLIATCVSSLQHTGRVACDTKHNAYIISMQVQSSFNDYDIACKLARFLRLSAHPGSFINCHPRMERVFTLHSNR